MGGTWRYLVMQLRNSNALKLGDIQCIKKQLPGELGFRNFINCQETFFAATLWFKAFGSPASSEPFLFSSRLA